MARIYGLDVDRVLTFTQRNVGQWRAGAVALRAVEVWAMGKLVWFRPTGRREEKNESGSARGATARILFFTGVRYQHYDGPGGPPEVDRRLPPSGDLGGAGGGRRKRRG